MLFQITYKSLLPIAHCSVFINFLFISIIIILNKEEHHDADHDDNYQKSSCHLLNFFV